MIQRYELEYMEDSREMRAHNDGTYVRYADIEPLLPKWVACSERLPSKAGQYTLLLAAGTISEDFWFADGQFWDEYLPGDVSHWLDFELPPLPQEPTP